jgi:ABC-type nitrate/sulfonate/bicarbonate transport system substrate-binding protein
MAQGLSHLSQGSEIVKRILVSAFPNAKALPLYIAQEQGLFAKRGIEVELDETEASKAQREGLASGRIQIVQSAIDNGLALIVRGHDIVIVMGGEGGMNDFIVQPEINSLGDLRGRRLVVDSPDTAYALLARKMLKAAGLEYGVDYDMHPVGNGSHRIAALLRDKENAGAVLNPPFTAQAKAAGMKSLGRLVDHLGPYQAGGAFAHRHWAQENGASLEAYIAGYVEALRWMRDEANFAAQENMLVARLRLAPDIAKATLQEMLEPDFGFATDAKLDMRGVTAVLETRAETEGDDPRLSKLTSFIDESWYERALASMGTR